jgi:hypothetical protein
MTKENMLGHDKELVRRFAEEVLNTNDFAVADKHLAPDHVEHSAPVGMRAHTQ